MTELKPCPFCGGTSVDVKYEPYPVPNHYIVCNYNKGGCGASSGCDYTVEEAIEAWNRRVGEEE